LLIIVKISYYAIIRNDDRMWVKFPDLDGYFSNRVEDNIKKMTKEAMELYLDNMEIDCIPSPNSVSDFTLEKN
jgi:hypothetical protein